MYVKIHDGIVAEFPYGFAELQRDNPYTRFRTADVATAFIGTEADLAGYTLEVVTALPRPDFDPVIAKCQPDETPALVDGVWVLGWTVLPKSEADIDAENQALTVLPWQLRAELLAMGRLDEAETLIASVGGESKIRWEYGTVFYRSHSSWDEMGAMMNPPITPADINDIFRAAGARV